MDPLDTPWKLLLEQFIEYLEARGYRRTTIEGYRYRIPDFLRYLQESALTVEEITPRHIQIYQGMLAEPRGPHGRTLSPGARHKAMGQVKGLFRFLYKTGRIYHDPAAGVEMPRKGKYLPRALLTVDEVIRLLKQPNLSTPIGVRNRAIMELVYSSGLRNEETTLLDIPDIDLSGRTLFVHGKGGRDAVVPFGREAARALEHYLHFARDTLLRARGTGRSISEQRKEKDSGTDPLFLTAQGYRMQTGTITHMVKYYTRRAGIVKAVTPHALRHACATHLLRNGADIRHIQRLLRHADISNTQLYTRVAIEDLKDAQTRYHPRERDRDA
jgi:integrase/recombinase XerD